VYAGTDDARGAVEHDFTVAHAAARMQERGDAANAVAALLHFAAVGVEDAVIEIGVGAARRLDLQDLVAAHAEVPVGDRAQLLRLERDRLLGRVEHHEIVAEAVHLRELQFQSLFSIT